MSFRAILFTVSALLIATTAFVFWACSNSGGGGGGDDDDDSISCDDFCDILSHCPEEAEKIGVESQSECGDLCSQSDEEFKQCIVDATNCTEVASCIIGGDVVLYCEVGDDSFDLEWTSKVNDPQRFHIYRTEPGQNNFSEIAVVTGSITSYSDALPTGEGRWDYAVAAEYYPPEEDDDSEEKEEEEEDAEGKSLVLSDMSNVANCVTKPLAPAFFDASLYGLAWGPYGEGFFWEDTSEIENEYLLYREDSDGWVLIATLPANTQEHHIDESVSEDFQRYRICAQNEAGCSDYVEDTATWDE